MTDPAQLREAIARVKSQMDSLERPFDNVVACDTDDLRAILAALPTDAVQPVGGVDREAIAKALDKLERVRWVREFYTDGRFVSTIVKEDIAPAADCLRSLLALYATAPTAGSGWRDVITANDIAGIIEQNADVEADVLHNPSQIAQMIYVAVCDAHDTAAPTVARARTGEGG